MICTVTLHMYVVFCMLCVEVVWSDGVVLMADAIREFMTANDVQREWRC